jgi:hypothetical protein
MTPFLQALSFSNSCFSSNSEGRKTIARRLLRGVILFNDASLPVVVYSGQRFSDI